MTQIKKILDKQGNEVFLRTSTKAVVDENGYTAESRLQAMQDEINAAQLEIGAVPSDLSPIEDSTNWVTSGGLYNQLNVGDANEEIDLTLYNDVSVAPSYSNNKWTSNATSRFIPVTPGKKYRIVANTSTAFFAFMVSDIVGENDDVVTTFASGSSTVSLNANTQTEVTAPSDAAYLNVRSTNSSVLPNKVVLINIKSIREVIFDTESTPTKNSDNLITSGGVKEGLEELEARCNSLYDSLNSEISIFDNETIDMTQYEEINAFISTGNKWVISNDYHGIFIPVSCNNKYKITTDTNNSMYAFLKNDEHLNNHSVSYATGSERTLINAGQSIVTQAPYDARYLYILTDRLGVDSYPSSVEINYSTSVSEFISNVISWSELDMSDYEVQNVWISSTNTWGSTQNKSIFIPVEKGELYRVYSDAKTCPYTFLVSDTPGTTGDSVTTFAEGCQIFFIVPGEYVAVSPPSDAKFLWIGIRSSSGSVAPSKIEVLNTASSRDKESDVATSNNEVLNETRILANYIANPLYPLNYNLDSSGYELATTRQELATLKIAKLYSKIKWTPLGNVPNNQSGYSANVEVTGIPYSSVQGIDKYIGQDVSIHTFMTAVNNPYSLLYTENINAQTSTSAWGKTYYGTNCASYYGVVCSSFASYCSGLSLRWVTVEFSWMNKYYPKVVKIYNQSSQGVRLGDIYMMPDHGRVITAIKRNQQGAVTNIKMTEALQQGMTETSLMTAASFDTKLKSEHAIIYRSTELYRSTYEDNEYVNVGDDLSVSYNQVSYNDDICTFAGDKACFREGDIIAIDYNLKSVGSWTSMELYKNDTLLDTITLDTEEHYVDLTSMELGYGQYKARLTDGSNYSNYTYFEIIETNVSYDNSKSSSNLKVIFSSSNGKPVSAMVCILAGNMRAHYELTDTDISNGYATIDVPKLNRQQNPEHPITEGTDYYLKVYFKGSYGRVTNEPILVELI